MEAYEQTYEDDLYIPMYIPRNILVKILAADIPVMRKYPSSDVAQVREPRALPFIKDPPLGAFSIKSVRLRRL